MRPVWMETPAADAEGPTVGAKCRGLVTAYAMGWLKSSGSGLGLRRPPDAGMSTSDTVTYPGSGPSYGGNTPTPALGCI